jgi:hypothetical protein
MILAASQNHGHSHQSHLCPHAPEAANGIITSMLAHISKSDVAHPGGHAEHNTGAVTMMGVTILLEAIGPLTQEDTFVDIGAGVGNVVFQVALQSSVGKCIGLEIRSDLTKLATSLLERHSVDEPRLRRVSIVNVDIAHVHEDVIPSLNSRPISSATTACSLAHRYLHWRSCAGFHD